MSETSAKENLPAAVPDAQSMAVSPAANKSAGSPDNEKKDAKEGGKGAYLLQKMRARKNSFIEPSATSIAVVTTGVQDSSDNNSIKSHTSHLSAQSSQSKGAKRSSKLLGKLVPKFLHTSHSPTQSTSGLSPLSQTPLSTRPSRSGSMVDQNPVARNEGMVSVETATVTTTTMPGSAAASSKGSQESLPLDPTAEEIEKNSSMLMVANAPDYLESLRSGSPSPCPSLGRRSSCSSNASKKSDNSLESKPSRSSMSSVDPAEEVTEENIGLKGQKSFCSVEITYEDDEEVNRSGAHKSTVVLTEAPMSPYIIDESCDDDFFLNSVLRKKSNSSLNTEEKPEMPSPMPSNTMMSGGRSGATTPSLSDWSSAPSRTSTPSPISPLLQDDQTYFPLMNSKMLSKHMQYRSSSLPSPINSGLDEKRSRLREAVSEWRRSASASL
ncbi:hypothetical protein EDD21DRAFT_74954 [Dissophora ornata]|nr:hypothetical protein EDD21DRAFT_74954 [Dissophora ornata]